MDKHGPKAIVLARFVPIIRTFAPMVAGAGPMKYRTFLTYNIIGGIGWGAGVTIAGYWLGQIEFIKTNVEPILVGIVLISVIPVVFEVLKARKESKANAGAEARRGRRPTAPARRPRAARPPRQALRPGPQQSPCRPYRPGGPPEAPGRTCARTRGRPRTGIRTTRPAAPLRSRGSASPRGAWRRSWPPGCA